MADYVDFKSAPSKVRFFKLGKYRFSDIELYHLSVAMVMIILTLFVFQNKGNLSLQYILSLDFLLLLGVYGVTVGFGFLFHELGHKFLAQHYGFVSEFRADFKMLFLIFGLALFLPIIMLAPGAVMVLGRPSRRQNGIISVAGPLVNLALGLFFLGLALAFGLSGILGTIIYVGMKVNAFLGVFNMLPFWVLDGKKVLAWSKPVYFVVMASLLVLLYVAW